MSKPTNPFRGLATINPEISQAANLKTTMVPNADTEVMLSLRVRSRVRKKLKTDAHNADISMATLVEQLILSHDPYAEESVPLSATALKKLNAAALSMGESSSDLLERLIDNLTVVRSERDT